MVSTNKDAEKRIKNPITEAFIEAVRRGWLPPSVAFKNARRHTRKVNEELEGENVKIKYKNKRVRDEAEELGGSRDPFEAIVADLIKTGNYLPGEGMSAVEMDAEVLSESMFPIEEKHNLLEKPKRKNFFITPTQPEIPSAREHFFNCTYHISESKSLPNLSLIEKQLSSCIKSSEELSKLDSKVRPR